MRFKLKRWRIVETDHGEHHLIGVAESGESRVSSAIRGFDPVTRRVTTRSGTDYHLVGPKGRDVESAWVLEHWLWWTSATIVDDDCDIDVLMGPPRASQHDLTSWRLLETSDGTLHVIGWSETTQEGHVSDALIKIEVTTRSGNVYRLLGQPGHDHGAEDLLKIWLEVNDLSLLKDHS